MFNQGVGQVQTDLKENGNQPAEFNVNPIMALKVEVKDSQSYINENGGKEIYFGKRNRQHETKRLYLSNWLPSFR